jgi:hypothetical protein
MPSPHPQKHAPVKHPGVKRLCASTETMTWINMVQSLWLGLCPLATLGFRLACLRPAETVMVNLRLRLFRIYPRDAASGVLEHSSCQVFISEHQCSKLRLQERGYGGTCYLQARLQGCGHPCDTDTTRYNVTMGPTKPTASSNTLMKVLLGGRYGWIAPAPSTTPRTWALHCPSPIPLEPLPDT